MDSLGGSNTANGQYVRYLDAFVKSNISQDSYVLNEGISGCDGSTFLGRSFPFEQWAKEKWPNIVIEEFSINMGSQDWEYVFGFLERLNHYLLFKWTRKGLPMPAVVILLTHRLNQLHFVMDELQTKADRIAFLNAWRNGTVCMYVNTLACMYVCLLFSNFLTIDNWNNKKISSMTRKHTPI